VLIRIAPSHGSKQVVIPKSLLSKVLYLEHYPTAVSHPGAHRMFRTMTRSFYWPHMSEDVYETVRQCDACPRNRISEVTEVGRNHKLESLVRGPYRALENADATFRLRIVAEDVRVSSDRVTPAPRRELYQPPEGNPKSSDPVPPLQSTGPLVHRPPIYRSEGQPRRPGKMKVRFDLPTPSKEARRPSSPDGASKHGDFVVEKLVEVWEAADGTRLYRVRWLGYEANEDTWEPESELLNAFIRRYLRTKGRATRH
jgi:hypothetical protein